MGEHGPPIQPGWICNRCAVVGPSNYRGQARPGPALGSTDVIIRVGPMKRRMDRNHSWNTMVLF